MSPPSSELRSLVDRLLDGGSLGRTDMARLEELLENDENLAYYLQTTQVEGALPDLLSQMPVSVMPWRGRFRVLGAVGLAAAAAVVFLFGFLAGTHRGSAPSGSAATAPAPALGPAARITGMMGVRWTSASHPDLLGSSGALDKLAIESGLVEITYASGVRVTVEGPAEFNVIDRESGRLESGKLVAAVPGGAEGFRIDYADGSVVDLGTEFAMEVRKDGPVEIGVFDGEVELHTAENGPLMPLFENHAVRHDRNDTEEPLQVIPFQRDKFVRQLPSRDFAWEIDSFSVEELDFDVSHLVWKPADYRAIFKWVNGPNALEILSCDLRVDGRSVARDEHSGITGRLERVKNNVFRLNLPEDSFQTGRWTLHMTVRAREDMANGTRPIGSIRSAGVLQFEEGLASLATAADFIGKWRYRFAGSEYVREIRPDGTVRLYENGKWYTPAFRNSHWVVEDGILKVYVPHLDATESHALRDRETMIFTSQPYENARRMPE